MKRFLNERIELAKSLAKGALNAHYADAVLVTTAVISSCAAIRWPGRNIDRKRFIELLATDSPDHFHTTWVSIPTLLNEGLLSVGATPYANGNEARVFCDHEVDVSLSEARTRYSHVKESELRKHSYAALIYERLRCGYAHEYWHHQDITHVSPSRKEARVSYIGRSVGEGLRRMMSFHPDYLFHLAEYHVSLLPREAMSYPARWWIEDG